MQNAITDRYVLLERRHRLLVSHLAADGDDHTSAAFRLTTWSLSRSLGRAFCNPARGAKQR